MNRSCGCASASSATTCWWKYSTAGTAGGTATVSAESRWNRTHGEGTEWEHRTTSSIEVIYPRTGTTHQRHETPATPELSGIVSSSSTRRTEDARDFMDGRGC